MTGDAVAAPDDPVPREGGRRCGGRGREDEQEGGEPDLLHRKRCNRWSGPKFRRHGTRTCVTVQFARRHWRLEVEWTTGERRATTAARLGTPVRSERESAMLAAARPAAGTDPQLAGLIEAEERRQRETFTLIASENHSSPAVLAASGSVLANKYSEGYPGRRYYEGHAVIDRIEQLA